jgi:hypothetical protein
VENLREILAGLRSGVQEIIRDPFPASEKKQRRQFLLRLLWLLPLIALVQNWNGIEKRVHRWLHPPKLIKADGQVYLNCNGDVTVEADGTLKFTDNAGTWHVIRPRHTQISDGSAVCLEQEHK